MSSISTVKKELVNMNLSFKAIIQDIRICQGPRDELDELNKKGRLKMKGIQSCLDTLTKLADEELDKNVKNALLFEVKNFNDEYLTTVAEFRKATVTCMLSLDVKARESLLTGSDGALTNHRKKKEKEDLAKDATDITDRLLSISRTLSDTTQRSADTLGTLEISSGVVGDTREELDAQGNVISESSKLLSKYGRREQTDKFLILLASAFFFACVAYILQKRLF